MAARKKREADPMTLLRELSSQLASGLARGYVLRGDERYFRDQVTDALRAKAAELSYEVCTHDGERGNTDFHLAAAIDDLSGMGLFGERRLVILRNVADHLKKDKTKASSLTSAILSFLADPGEPGCVVVAVPTLRADHAVSKAISAAGGPVLNLRKLWDGPPPWNPDPRQSELVRWLLDRARTVGVRLSPDQAVYVCAATGNDLAALDDQLERLKHSSGESLADVVGWDAASAPWTVAETLLAGDVARSLAGVEALFRSGFQEKSGRRLVDPTALAAMVVGSLTRGIRRSLLVASELERGKSETETARIAGITGRAVGGAIAQARQRPARAWEGMLHDVAKLERRAKSSAGVTADDFALLALAWKA